MAFGFKRTIQAKGPDRFIVTLHENLRDAIIAACEEVRAELDDDAIDEPGPHLRRLFPVAHASDESIDRAYQDLVHNDLVRTRREALETVMATARQDELDRATLESWLSGLNIVRLVIGTRLDVSEDVLPEIDADDPNLPMWALYEFLGILVGMIVDALARTA